MFLPCHNCTFHRTQWDVQIAQRTILGWNDKPSDPKASNFVSDISILLFGGKNRAVENEYMLFILTMADDVFFYAGKKPYSFYSFIV